MPMPPAKFTRDANRIAILEANWQAGVDREQLPIADRVKLDMDALVVTPAHLAKLRAIAGLQ